MVDPKEGQTSQRFVDTRICSAPESSEPMVESLFYLQMVAAALMQPE